ncbi:MAG: lytic transglycosylase domain-containing protein [Deltaproteobacteria bacterium]|nr:lytic transglycosylase domain-containing protein [Deltaproteobacteria bacterium]
MKRFWLLVPVLAFYCALSLARETEADIYAYRDSRGVLRFTNAPTHSSYRVVIRTPRKRPSSSSRFPRRFERIVRSASDRYGVDPNLVSAMIKVESNFNPHAVSRKGARGLMQLMPETARNLDVGDIYDPTENINGGVRHLKLLLDRFGGNQRMALAAYNAGAKAVERYRGVPPFSETREYVRLVLRYYRLYGNNEGVSLTEQVKR